MVIPLMIHGVLLGVLLGVILGYCMARWWQLRAQRKCNIDRLIAQFHALFRQIDQKKQQHP